MTLWQDCCSPLPLEQGRRSRGPRPEVHTSGRVRFRHRVHARSERGTRTAALFYSLIESAKLCSVEPRAYLREAALRAVRNPGTVTLARELKSSES